MHKKLSEVEPDPPSEDTFFLADHIKDEKGESALDIGTGSGYLSSILEKSFSLVVGTDLLFNVLRKRDYNTTNSICCNGADVINHQFDLIVCNMPYLNTDSVLDVRTDGGKSGLEIPMKIIDSAKSCIKPEGKGSLVLGTSSGVHAWHNHHYKRRLRVGKNEAIYKYLLDNVPEIIEDEVFYDLCLGIPNVEYSFNAWVNSDFDDDELCDDVDDDDVCDNDEIIGCQDDTACNYNVLATDAGECYYVDGICETCSGETDGSGTVVDNDLDDDTSCDDDEVIGCEDDNSCHS